ncbi:MAG TPA: hypothetical protein VFA81_08350 [Burkholderiales bacterium]|nr:hypothetical protein [Burkholderiales bacterium]
MPRFKIAHLREQGQDMIIVPVDGAFQHKPAADQQQVRAELQMRARAAGLAGTVVPVWPDSSGRMHFIAPEPWHPFFKSLSLPMVYSALNRELYW